MNAKAISGSGMLALSCALLGTSPALGQTSCRGFKPAATLDANAIIEYSGRSNDYSLVRGGKPAQVVIFGALQNDDRLSVTSPSGKLSVQLGNGAPKTLTSRSGTICILRPPPPSLFDRVLAIIGVRISSRQDRQQGTVIGRGQNPDAQLLAGGPLTIADPALSDGSARISAGRRNLAFAWRGGTAPFELRLIDAGGHSLVNEAGLSEHVLLMEAPVDLPQGSYRIQISDARGATIGGSFSATAGASRPAPDSAQQALIDAARKIRLGKEYRYDALLILAPYLGTNETVDQLATYLIEGDD